MSDIERVKLMLLSVQILILSCQLFAWAGMTATWLITLLCVPLIMLAIIQLYLVTPVGPRKEDG